MSFLPSVNVDSRAPALEGPINGALGKGVHLCGNRDCLKWFIEHQRSSVDVTVLTAKLLAWLKTSSRLTFLKG